MHCAATRRFYLEVAATGRFRVVREWELDGYRMAVPERLHDVPPPEPSAEASEELAELAKAVEADADAWIARLGCACRLACQVVSTAGFRHTAAGAGSGAACQLCRAWHLAVQATGSVADKPSLRRRCQNK